MIGLGESLVVSERGPAKEWKPAMTYLYVWMHWPTCSPRPSRDTRPDLTESPKAEEKRCESYPASCEKTWAYSLRPIDERGDRREGQRSRCFFHHKHSAHG